MTDIREAFTPLAEAYKKQFNLDLEIGGVGIDEHNNDSEVNLVDSTNDGVSRVGSVKSNWLKRNAPKFGFVRKGESATFTWNGKVVPVEMAAPVAAEEAEIAALATVAEYIDRENEAPATEEYGMDFSDEEEPEAGHNPNKGREKHKGES